ncbi:MAG: alpha/beta hydrolase [Arachidicoccus sp.]|nr:alpha/beta hydrolase [Arachidicoccus sp.]
MFYQVNDIQLFVADEGEKSPTLLFIHFWGGSSNTWKPVTDILHAKYRCIRYDQRGWGKSDKPKSGYDIQSLADDVVALVEALQLEEYILVGHSMGGKIAQAVAGRNPKGLRKLILIAPSPATPTIVLTEMKQGMIAAYTSLENINGIIEQVFKASDLSLESKQQVIEDMQHHSAESRCAWPELALEEDVSECLPNIKIPTLVIAGENDIVDAPARLKQEVAQKIHNAEMAVIPNVGHLIMLQAPKKVAELINVFCK